MIVIANWKMNLDFKQSLALAEGYLNLDLPASFKIIVLASDLVLQDLAIKFGGSNISVFAQDCSRFADKGSYTGEISAEQLKKIGVKGVLLGHMERRVHLNEDDEDIALKVRAALRAGLKVILSVGDTKPGQSFTKDLQEMDRQLTITLRGLKAEELKGSLLLAYESATGISSLRSTSDKEDDLDQIIMKLDFLNTWTNRQFGLELPLLYGGSLEVKDLGQLYGSKLLKGFLIGRNSLQLKSFEPLIKALSYL